MSSGGVNDGDLPELLEHLVLVVMHVNGPCLQFLHASESLRQPSSSETEAPRHNRIAKLRDYALSLTILLG
jgi:hypothetical protein